MEVSTTLQNLLYLCYFRLWVWWSVYFKWYQSQTLLGLSAHPFSLFILYHSGFSLSLSIIIPWSCFGLLSLFLSLNSSAHRANNISLGLLINLLSLTWPPLYSKSSPVQLHLSSLVFTSGKKGRQKRKSNSCVNCITWLHRREDFRECYTCPSTVG